MCWHLNDHLGRFEMINVAIFNWSGRVWTVNTKMDIKWPHNHHLMVIRCKPNYLSEPLILSHYEQNEGSYLHYSWWINQIDVRRGHNICNIWLDSLFTTRQLPNCSTDKSYALFQFLCILKPPRSKVNLILIFLTHNKSFSVKDRSFIYIFTELKVWS